MPTTNHTNGCDVLHVDSAELRDTIGVTIDREVIGELDRQRSGVSRSGYLEMVLTANLPREYPHLADDWTPERAGEQRFARLVRYLQSGR